MIDSAESRTAISVIPLYEGFRRVLFPDLPPLNGCVCVHFCRCALYTCMIEVPQSVRRKIKKKKSDGRVGAGETDSKTTSNILFSLMGCQMGGEEKKKHEDEQRGPTFSLHTNRKGLWERKSHRPENSPLVVPIKFPGNQLGDLSLRWNPPQFVVLRAILLLTVSLDQS